MRCEAALFLLYAGFTARAFDVTLRPRRPQTANFSVPMTLFPHITRDPAVMSGRACLRDTHVTVSTVVTLMASGRSDKEIMRMFPVLTAQDLLDALAYSAWWLDEQDTPSLVPERQQQPEPVSPLRTFAGPAVLPPMEAPESPKILEQFAAPEVPAQPVEEQTEAEEEAEFASEENAVEDEVLELIHPAYPDKPTVVLSRNGIFDRRWDVPTIAWCDIRGIQRISGEKSIYIVLRNPENYLSSMPFFKQMHARIKLFLNILTFHLDTSSLGVRTRDLYIEASRLWVNYRGDVRFRKKRRIRSTERTISSEKIED